MATTTLTNNFRRDVLNGVINLSADQLQMALYNGSGHNANTGAYTVTNEASGTGYTAKGVTMSGAVQATDTTNNVSHYDWTINPTWAASTITATDCLLFDEDVTSPTGDVSIYVGDFNGSKSSSSGTFEIILPAANYNTSLVRLA